MIDFLAIKLKLSNTILADKIINSKSISKTEKKISKKIEGLEHDDEEVQTLRQNNRNEIRKLERALNRSENRELESLEKKTMKDIRKYENNMRRQLQDLMQIIKQLKRLIENEDLELIYDVKKPLNIFEEFIKQLKKAVKGIKVDKQTGEQLKNIINNITKTYEELTDHIINFIKGDLEYFQNLGLKFNNIENGTPRDKTLADHLQERGKIKQQINGKTQWIISQIKQLEKILEKPSKNKSKNLEEHEKEQETKIELLKHIDYFRKQFKELTEYCITRADTANHMIAEAILIQKDKYEELAELKSELEKFYEEFLQEQEELSQNTDSNWRSRNADKRVQEFEILKDEVTTKVKKFEDKFDKKIMEAEEKDLEDLKMEKKEIKKQTERLPKFKKKLKRVAAGAAIIFLGATSISMGMNKPYLTTTQAAESAYRQIVNVTNPKVVKNIIKFLSSREGLKEINNRNMQLNKEINKRELSKEELEFVKNELKAISVGGFAKGYGPAPLIVSRYSDNQKGVLKIPGKIYQESEAVNYVQNILTQKVIEAVRSGQKSGTIKSTDQGVITKKKVFKKNGHHNGQVNSNGILVSPRFSKLHYTDNSYPLHAHFKTDGDNIQIKFEIPTQKYDYSNSPKGSFSIISTPSGDLKIPDHLLGQLERKGVFNPVEYTSEWTQNISIQESIS